MKSSVLWWCYQESQQKKSQKEQLKQSEKNMRESRNIKRKEIKEFRILEEKMIKEGIPFEDIEKCRKIDFKEEEFLLQMEEEDAKNEILDQKEMETKLRAAAITNKRRENIKRIYNNDRNGRKRNHGQKKKTDSATVGSGHYVHGSNKGDDGDDDKYATHFEVDVISTTDLCIENTMEELIQDVLSTVLEKFWWYTVASDVRRYCSQFNLLDGPADPTISRGKIILNNS